MENTKFLNQKDVLNVAPAKETVQLWPYSYKSVKAVDVYGMRELVLKIHRVMAVVDKKL
jgi:hypothetical protein